MNHPLLNDPNEFPADSVLARYLGSCFSSWTAFMKLLGERFPQAKLEWRYYKDGKSWLCKVAVKKDTLCWVSIWDRFFKTGFYFTAKAEELIKNSALDPALKHSFLHPSEKPGKLRPITIYVRRKIDLGAVKELLVVKLKVKEKNAWD